MDLSDSVLDHLRHVAALPDLTGTRYELESEIGRGGMGVVYAARDRQLDRRVALKVLDFAMAGEAQLIARLEHPAVVPVYETGTLADGRPFYAMKLVSGARLDRYRAEPTTLTECLRVIRRVGEALAFAHSHGIIHRDLKPQNVMVGPFGEVYVMDWGVDAVAGTPAFRAPDDRLDQRSDIYALGALLQFLLQAPAPLALRAIVAKAMSADPTDRYPDVPALLADIERFEQGLAIEAWSEPLWHKLRRFGSGNAVLLWLLVAYTLVKFLLFFLRKF
ncbi:MAG TPA: serine/threonine-protein kinase [Terriglobales bacterium]|nr:serine/threonine-protein kinase [Terriglobales bacterium]